MSETDHALMQTMRDIMSEISAGIIVLQGGTVFVWSQFYIMLMEDI